MALPLSEAMETNRDRMYFILVHSPIEEVFRSFVWTDHLWLVGDETARDVLGLLTFEDVRQLIAPVKPTYSSLNRQGMGSLRHQSVGCLGCLMEKKQLYSLPPTRTVSDALEIMEIHNLSYLAVREQNEFRGEISVRQLSKSLSEFMGQSKGEVA
jgi:CBS domain-containing protein